MMSIIRSRNIFLEKKISQYYTIANMIGWNYEINENNFVDESCLCGIEKDYALSKLALKISEILQKIIPEVNVTNENHDLIVIAEENCIRALTLFLAHFQDYLSSHIIALLKESVNIHLMRFYDVFKAKYKNVLNIGSKAVGITIIGYTDDNKHIGNVDVLLRERGIEIVYFCNSMNSYKNLKKRICNLSCLVFVAHPIYYAYISKVKVLLSTNTPLPLQKMENLSTKIVHLGHNFNEALQYTLWRTDEEFVFKSLKRERLDRCHYVVAHTKNDYKVLQKTCEYFNIDEARILKGGNPSLDWTLHKYKESARLKEEENRRYLLLAPSYLENFLGDCQIVSILEQIMDIGIFLVIRPHPLYIQRDCMKYHGILDDWSRKYNNFKIDDSQKYFNEYLINSFTLLTDESSMGVSYPYFTLRPSLIYIKEARRKGIGIDGIRLYNASLNILIDDFNELRKNILKLSSRGGGDENSNIIQKFRDQQVYHLMNSSCYLSNLIEKML